MTKRARRRLYRRTFAALNWELTRAGRVLGFCHRKGKPVPESIASWAARCDHTYALLLERRVREGVNG